MGRGTTAWLQTETGETSWRAGGERLQAQRDATIFPLAKEREGRKGQMQAAGRFSELEYYHCVHFLSKVQDSHG